MFVLARLSRHISRSSWRSREQKDASAERLKLKCTMKRKLLFAALPAIVAAGILSALSFHSRPIIPERLSRENFTRIQRAIRNDMWRKAFPATSWSTIERSPRSLSLLATTRILEIEVLGQQAV